MPGRIRSDRADHGLPGGDSDRRHLWSSVRGRAWLSTVGRSKSSRGVEWLGSDEVLRPCRPRHRGDSELLHHREGPRAWHQVQRLCTSRVLRGIHPGASLPIVARHRPCRDSRTAVSRRRLKLILVNLAGRYPIGGPRVAAPAMEQTPKGANGRAALGRSELEEIPMVMIGTRVNPMMRATSD